MDRGNRAKTHAEPVKHEGGVGRAAVVDEVGERIETDGQLGVVVVGDGEAVVVQTAYAGQDDGRRASLLVEPRLRGDDAMD